MPDQKTSDVPHRPHAPSDDGRIRRVVGRTVPERDPLERLAELNAFVAQIRPDDVEPDVDDFVRVVVGRTERR
jgi:hypothetical protein